MSPRPALTKIPVPGGLYPGACSEEGGWGETGQGESGQGGWPGVPLWGCRAWAVPIRLPPCWQQLFAGIWATFHGDQCQDRPQRGLSLHSHSKVSPGSHPPDPGSESPYWGHRPPYSMVTPAPQGVEAAFYEGPQRAPLPAARLCQEGGPRVLLLQTLNPDGNGHQAFRWEAQLQPSHWKADLQVPLICHPAVNPRVSISRTHRLSLALPLSWRQSTALVLTMSFREPEGLQPSLHLLLPGGLLYRRGTPAM